MDNRPAHEKADPYTADPEAHQAFVLQLVKSFAGGHPVSDEMLSDANFGLALACRNYDPQRMVNGRRVKFITFAYHCIWHEMTRGRAARCRFIPVPAGRKLIPIDSPNSADLADNHCESEQIESDIIEKLHWAVEHLPERDREIIKLRLAGETLEQIGDRLDLTKERVRQLQNLAYRKLHSYLYDMGVRGI
jgi:RNA polymerase sigma factor (sigma-70 family)